MATVQEVLRTWRGPMSADRAAVRVSDLLGQEISRETVYRYERPTTSPESMNPLVVLALAVVYGHDPDGLPLPFPDRIERIRSLLRHPGTTEDVGLVELSRTVDAKGA